MNAPGHAGRPRSRRDRLQVAIVVNQLATPGLGSWWAGHRLAGAGQLLLACAGFGLYLAYFARLLIDTWRAVSLDVPPDPTPDPGWKTALILFGIAWLWAGVTSIQMALELRRTQSPPADSLPPRLPLP